MPNQSGGFLGYWWSGRRDEDSEQYLQLEMNALCFKVSVGEAARRGDVRDRWVARMLQAGRDLNFDVARPARLGQTMTVAWPSTATTALPVRAAFWTSMLP